VVNSAHSRQVAPADAVGVLPQCRKFDAHARENVHNAEPLTCRPVPWPECAGEIRAHHGTLMYRRT
jgi:hypothetical protein